MLRLAWRSVLAHSVRLGLTAAAIVLGVSFVAGTFVFTDSLSRSFDGLFAQPAPDVLVTAADQTGGGGGGGGQPLALSPALVPVVAAVSGAQAAEGFVSAQGAVVLDREGQPITGANPSTLGTSWMVDPDLRPFTLVSGRAPETDGEVVLEAGTATKAGVAVGDTVRIITPFQEPSDWSLVGTVDASLAAAAAGGSVVIFDLTTAQARMLGSDEITGIRVAARPGVSQADLKDQVTAVLPAGTLVRTGSQVQDETAARLKSALGFVDTFLLVFAIIALFVSAFLILNTYSILVAQRTRELALLRAIGATNRQVRRSVLVEALVVAVIASSLGLGVGVGLALGLRSLVGLFGLSLPSTPLVVEPRTIVATYLVGIVVTVLSAWFPARRAGRVAPVAAMRMDSAPAATSLRRRVIAGCVLLALACAAAVVSLRAPGDVSPAGIAGIAAGLALVATIVLGPILATPVVSALAVPLRSSVARMASGNARRNPRRTSATASALAIGLALMSALSVLASSATASISAVIDRTIGADFVIVSTSFRPFPAEVFSSVEGTPGTSVVTYVRQVNASLAATGRGLLTGVQPDLIGSVISTTFESGSFAELQSAGTALVDRDLATAAGVTVGDDLAVTLPQGVGSVRIAGIYEPAGPFAGLVVSVDTLASLVPVAQDTAVYVMLAPGADASAVQADLASRLASYPIVTVQDQAQFKAEIADRINRVLGLLVALLGLAVIIAFLGIVNTLSLSVLERTREIGLLRAIGAVRPQVRRMILIEAGFIAILGSLIGTVLGVAIGAILQRSLAADGFEVLSIPFGQLAGFLLLGIAGGIVAAAWPAWRASRLNLLAAIASE